MLHRDDDKPAIEWWDGKKEWYYNGVRHRENGKPTVTYPDGKTKGGVGI